MVDIKTITAENIDTYINENPDTPLILIFQAIWSTACLILLSNIEEAIEKTQGYAIWGKIDLDVEHALAERFSIITMPTILVIHKGEIVKQYFGVQESDLFIDMVKELTGREIVVEPGK